MGKWTSHILRPEDRGGKEDHIPIEGIAQLADGRIDPAERQRYMAHLNRCRECYDLLKETLVDLPEEAIHAPEPARRWGRPMAAMAASLILVLLVGGVLMFKTRQSPQFMMASLSMDQTLMDILVEDDALVWEKGERVDRLAALLRSRGFRAGTLNRVVLSKPYFPSKSFSGPGEVLSIRIENGVAFLEVLPVKPEKKD